MTAASAYTPTDSGWGLWFLVAVVVLATVAVGVAWIARRIAEPCPECGERGACAVDAEGRALIHVTEEVDDGA